MGPKLGQIVNYTPTLQQRNEMKERHCNQPEELPAVVVAVHTPEVVNLKVLLDGPGDKWATSVHQGLEEGEWDFYPNEELNQAELDAVFEKVKDAKEELEGIIFGLSAIKQELTDELDQFVAKYEDCKTEHATIAESIAFKPIPEDSIPEPEMLETIKGEESAIEKKANAEKVS